MIRSTDMFKMCRLKPPRESLIMKSAGMTAAPEPTRVALIDDLIKKILITEFLGIKTPTEPIKIAVNDMIKEYAGKPTGSVTLDNIKTGTGLKTTWDKLNNALASDESGTDANTILGLDDTAGYV